MKEEYYDLPAELLVKGVIKTHHDRIVKLLNEITAGFKQLVSSYGDSEPDLVYLYIIFSEFAWKLEAHISKEKIAVIPFVNRYTKELSKGSRFRKAGLHSACPSIDKMYLEHKEEKQHFSKLLQLIDQVKISDKQAYIQYINLCTKILEFQTCWHEQVQLEDNILFPKIIEMEAILNPI